MNIPISYNSNELCTIQTINLLNIWHMAMAQDWRIIDEVTRRVLPTSWGSFPTCPGHSSFAMYGKVGR